ncbi:MAG: fused MFS/spermidine synthase [Planctomycetes bacterium]|nr:fused MFS/spermidine synthase [Planctomycetota bacterium]MCB9828875.1 fused MFS/spermidine synthase [Planctomycetota bacterium]MCB9902003.1 fused MFS/spermidine synthase [Planctomycetota bacterium]
MRPEGAPAARRRPTRTELLVALAAFLVFAVQPLAGRRLLPRLGGTPAVWAASLVVFQTLYLLAQALAHTLARRPAWRRPGLVVLLGLAIANAVFTWRTWGAPGAQDDPALWLVGTLALGLGPLVTALAVTTPLLHRAFVERGGAPERAWRLVAWGSAGSLAALLLYPTLLEPAFGVRALVSVWGPLAAVVVACVAVMAWPRARASAPIEREPGLRWPRETWGLVLRAALASGLFLAVTAHITTDLAPVPLLWVVPLGLFLLASILAFVPRAEGLVTLAGRSVVPLAVVVAGLLLAERTEWMPVQLLVFLAFVLAASLDLWGALARRRPDDPARATGWYLATAIGGALGGLGVGLLAPWCLNGPYELPLLLFGVVAVRGIHPTTGVMAPRPAWPAVLKLVLGAALVITLFEATASLRAESVGFLLLVVLATVATLLLWLAGRPALLGGLAALLVLPTLALHEDFDVVARERTFFGTHTVLAVDGSYDEGGHHRLLHGRTIHGVQLERKPGLPTLYYGRATPIGDVMEDLAARAPTPRVGIVGLGAGTLLAYAREGWSVRVIEIDEAVVRIASDPKLFTFVHDTKAAVTTTVGDGRRELEHLPAGSFDLLVVDAFSSDAVPVHLLTREAVQGDLRVLADGGLAAFHVSSQYVDLVPVLGAAARADGALAVTKTANGSHWVVVARRDEDVAALRARGFEDAAVGRAWTDDRVHLLDALR